MDSKPYLRDVVILTNMPTSKDNLGPALTEMIKGKKDPENLHLFPKDTTFYLICGFHTTEKGEVGKYEPELEKQFREMIKDLSKKIDETKEIKVRLIWKFLESHSPLLDLLCAKLVSNIKCQYLLVVFHISHFPKKYLNLKGNCEIPIFFK